MKFDDLVNHILNESDYHHDGLTVPFRYLGFRYIVVGNVDYDTEDTNWDNWDVEIWDIYDRDETKPENIGQKIEYPDEGIITKAKEALRDDANERGIEAGHFQQARPEKEFNWEDLDKSN